MIAIPQQPPEMTVEEYLEWEPQQDVRYEYANGEVFAMTGGTIPHNDIALNLYTALHPHLRSRGCRANVSGVKVQLTPQSRYYYPDVIVSFAVQIAKALGAVVTGVSSTKNLDLVKSLGADRVIDYTQQDFTADTAQYDIIFDAVGKRSLSQTKRVLKPNGIYITTLPSPEVFLESALTAFLPGQKAKFIIQKPNTQDLIYMKELIESGKIRVVIDRTYPLQELAAAHSYSESERAVGKIALVQPVVDIAI